MFVLALSLYNTIEFKVSFFYAKSRTCSFIVDNIPEMVFNASNCGDNCAAWLLKLGKEKDVTINLRHIMDFGDNEFEIYVMNTDSIVHNMDELVRVAGRYV